MYKLSADGKTMVGCNEDAWRITSNIWFENALESGQYGAAFTGSRQVSAGRTAPQSGMNEAGLVFSRLVAYHPIEENPFTDRLQISDEVDYLSASMHQWCSCGGTYISIGPSVGLFAGTRALLGPRAAHPAHAVEVRRAGACRHAAAVPLLPRRRMIGDAMRCFAI